MFRILDVCEKCLADLSLKVLRKVYTLCVQELVELVLIQIIRHVPLVLNFASIYKNWLRLILSQIENISGYLSPY